MQASWRGSCAAGGSLAAALHHLPARAALHVRANPQQLPPRAAPWAEIGGGLRLRSWRSGHSHSVATAPDDARLHGAGPQGPDRMHDGCPHADTDRTRSVGI
jgi:hypothetical protein